ncbi:MAG: hypothetical protein KKH32_07135, partial [Bacteroidetes bacterium]|nr:hypothetical protein [Bacteroidota bacterium]
MKIHIIFFPILLLFIFIGESFSQKEEKIFVEADSLTKEKIENYLEQNKKRNQKIQYEILRVKPPENIDYKILYAYI